VGPLGRRRATADAKSGSTPSCAKKVAKPRWQLNSWTLPSRTYQKSSVGMSSLGRREIRDDIHEAFLSLACATICWRRLRNPHLVATW
jgi:hypothetical protein